MSMNRSTSNYLQRSFTGRVAGWSASHRWLVLLATVLILVVSFGLASSLGIETSEVVGRGDARHGAKLIEERFDIVAPPAEVILISNPSLDVGDSAFHSTVEALIEDLKGLEGVASVGSYYDTGLPFMVSEDRHALMVRLEFELAEQSELREFVGPVIDAVVAADQRAEGDGFEIGVVGGTSFGQVQRDIAGPDLANLILVALGGGFIIMVLAFGAVLAALIPLALALAAIFAAVGAAALVSQVQELNSFYFEMIALLGLAVGIDYSLFIVNRFREERAAGRSKLEAIQVCGDTTSRAVFYAGATVLISLAGLALTRDALFIGLALGAIIVVLFAIVGSLTLLPALLSLLDHRINWLRIPGLGRPSRGGGVWGAISNAVLARPWVFATVTLAGLLALSVPLFSLHIGRISIQNFIDWDSAAEEGGSIGVMATGIELLEEHFTLGESGPLVVVVDPGVNGNVDTTATQDSVAALLDAVGQDEAFAPPFDTQTNQEGNLLRITVPLAHAEDEDLSEEAVRRLRDLAPKAFQGTGVEVFVAGGTAGMVDFRENMKATGPMVFAFVLGFAFLVFLIMFRSVVIPVKAIVLNLISVGAAYGVLVLVFQEGVGESLLGFKAIGRIDFWIPMFLFAILFGLSMDYHMLLLNRIKEAYDAGHSNEESVSMGIKATAPVITSAALIMVLVFGAFATSRVLGFKMIGVGLAVAILIDATIIRAILLPASMKLLGDWNWYLPKWLEWLPRVSAEGDREVEAVTLGD